MKELSALPVAWPVTKKSDSLIPEHSEDSKSVNKPPFIQVAYKPPAISRCGLSELIADCLSMISFTFSIVLRIMYLWPNIFNETMGPNMMMSAASICQLHGYIPYNFPHSAKVSHSLALGMLNAFPSNQWRGGPGKDIESFPLRHRMVVRATRQATVARIGTRGGASI
jgi:hypothetical protein